MDQADVSWYSALVPMMNADALAYSGQARELADYLEEFMRCYPDAELRNESRRVVVRLRRIAEIRE